MFTPEAEATAWGRVAWGRVAWGKIDKHRWLMKEKKAKDKKLKWRKKVITITVPLCPECGCDMDIITDDETGIEYEYLCRKCDKLY